MMLQSLAPKIILTKKEKREDSASVPEHHSTWGRENGVVSHPWFQLLPDRLP